MRSAALVLASLLAACGACGGDFTVGEARPVTVHVPRGFDAARPTPLLLVLHAFSGDPEHTGRWLGLRDEARRRGLLYAAPQGTRDRAGNLFWNAGACCDFDGAGVDDVAYLDGVVDAIAARVRVDPRRVYAAGFSNGGFMAYRLACDRPARFAAVVSIAGAIPEGCAGGEPVSVLHVHGDADRVVPFGGGLLFTDEPVPPAWRRQVPGAAASTARFAALAGCGPSPGPTGAKLDLDPSIPGAETTVLAYAGCGGAAGVELWRMAGSVHGPERWSGDLAGALVDFLLAHPRG